MSEKRDMLKLYPDPVGKYNIDIVNTGCKSIYIHHIDTDGYYDYIYYQVILHMIDKKPEVLGIHRKKIYYNNINCDAYFIHDGFRVYLRECYRIGGPWGIA